MGRYLVALDFLVNLGGPFLVTKQGMNEEVFASSWSIPGFRFTFYLMTVVWGAGLLIEATLKIILAFTIQTGLFLVVSPIISYSIYFGLLGWSIWYGNQRRKLGERLAAAGNTIVE